MPSGVSSRSVNCRCSTRLVGKTALFAETGEHLFSNHMTRLRVRRELVEPGFLARYLHWTWQEGGLRSFVNQWISQAAINTSQIARITLSLPPLSEQRRIVEILDQADALRRARAEADAKAQRIVPALFQQMLGDPATNPKDWPLHPVGELAEVQGGLQLSPKRRELPLLRPYLRVANVQRDFLVLDEIKEIGLTEDELGRVLLQPGDVLVVEGNGNPTEIGRAAIWDGSIDGCVHQNHLIRIRCRESQLEPEYLLAFINSPSGQQYFHVAGNTTSGLVTISTGVVNRCRIPVPPIELQQSFSSQAKAVRSLRAGQAQATARCNRLFDVLLSRAFTGELTAKWREMHRDELGRELEQQKRLLEGRGSEQSDLFDAAGVGLAQPA
ncbi:MAG: restriction endonuclease subunit S [Chloroflexi bacterium]|nr:restriction endonuclease subunit S [Chloroflexota bacterium]